MGITNEDTNAALHHECQMKPIVYSSIFAVPMIINVSVWVKSIATMVSRLNAEIHT